MAWSRHTVEWSLPSGDQAQNTLWVDSQGLSITAVSAAVATSFQNSWAGLSGSINQNTVAQRVVSYSIPEGGGEATDQAETSISRAGGSTGNSLPPQIAVVCTLGTGRPGRSFRGRLFLPAPAVIALAANGRLATSVRNNYSTFVAAWLGGVNNALSRSCVVVSLTRGVATPITSITVGDVFDTQRRRRNALEEASVTTAVSQV